MNISSQNTSAIVWFRQNLRLEDNPLIQKAISSHASVMFVFIGDEDGEEDWALGGASKWWLHHSLKSLQQHLKNRQSSLHVFKGDSQQVLKTLVRQWQVTTVYCDQRIEPYALKQEQAVAQALQKEGVCFESLNISYLVNPTEVLNGEKKPYRVFTPFYKACMQRPFNTRLPDSVSDRLPNIFPPSPLYDAPIQSDCDTLASCSIDDLSLLPTRDWSDGFLSYWQPGELGAKSLLQNFMKNTAHQYEDTRDFPSIKGVSRLSPHLHFGEISPHSIVRQLSHLPEAAPYIRQLYWREFSFYQLSHSLDITREPFRKEFMDFPWRDKAEYEEDLTLWKKGMTGYPLVDAGMRELWATGWMHNRVRMVVASFLTKHLLIPWQEGARWFWDTLLDADLANNTMGWQWVAGCGVDAAPYFRVFNPILQSKKFDEKGDYIRQWVPELAHVESKYIHEPWLLGGLLMPDYPEPVIPHSDGRARALQALEEMKAKGRGQST